MREANAVLQNDDGLHARSAAQFVRVANQFVSDITLVAKGEEVNGKSIIGIMSLGIYSGQEITLRAEGEDEDEAIERLSHCVENELI
ncbi:MAG: HPr family phosphocarrier protein [Tissierellia bacterium]|nr:HPr family phosphocarrier protein [Tissierellia bacterium]